MAEKTLNTRIVLKYDTLENWSKTTTAGQGANLVLKKGELAICYVPSVTNETTTTAPTVLMKVGDGTSTFSALPWAAGNAADVYSWAKASTKPSYSASEITGLQSFVEGISDTDTNTQYQLVADGDNKIKVQSKSIGGSFADVSGQTIELVQDSTDKHKIGLKFGDTDISTWLTIPDNNDNTKNTAGSTDTSSKIYLIGATSQAANPQTYSHDTAYVGTDGNLYSGGTKVKTVQTAVTSPTASSTTSTTFIDTITQDENGVITATKKTLPKYAGSASAGGAATSVANALSIGGKTYNGSAAVSITASDLGISNAMHFIGKATVAVTDGGTEDPTITGYSTKTAGDVILDKDGKEEYVWTGTAWENLGDGNSYVVKEDGKGLSTNDYTTAEKNKLAGLAVTSTSVTDGTNTFSKYTHPAGSGASKSSGLYKFSTDSTSHISGVTAVTKADITGLGIPSSDTTYTFDGTYNASTNKAATVSTVTDAINGLDSSVSATAASGNIYSVLTGVTETDGKLTSKTEVTLSAVAKTGNVEDLTQDSGDVLVFDCGSSTVNI